MINTAASFSNNAASFSQKKYYIKDFFTSASVTQLSIAEMNQLNWEIGNEIIKKE